MQARIKGTQISLEKVQLSLIIFLRGLSVMNCFIQFLGFGSERSSITILRFFFLRSEAKISALGIFSAVPCIYVAIKTR